MNEPEPFSAETPEQVWAAIARSLADEETPEQRDALRRTLAAHPERAALVSALRGVVDRLPPPAMAPAEVDAALERVRAKLAAPAPRLARRPAARWTAALVPLAAVLILAAGIGLLWRQLRAPAPALQWATADGERQSLTLEDGTRVRLGPRSRIAVPAGFGRRERAVELTGDGWFQATHDAAHPFVVRTPTAVVRDLGTTFTVRADAGGSRVVVTGGAVALSPRAVGGEVVLRAGDRAAVDPRGAMRVERGAATGDDVAWTEGRLVFRDAPLRQVASDLSRWYGVVVVVRDPALARRRVTATFRDQSADDALGVVAAVLGAEIQRRGDTAFVSPRAPR